MHDGKWCLAAIGRDRDKNGMIVEEDVAHSDTLLSKVGYDEITHSGLDLHIRKIWLARAREEHERIIDTDDIGHDVQSPPLLHRSFFGHYNRTSMIQIRKTLCKRSMTVNFFETLPVPELDRFYTKIEVAGDDTSNIHENLSFSPITTYRTENPQ